MKISLPGYLIVMTHNSLLETRCLLEALPRRDAAGEQKTSTPSARIARALLSTLLHRDWVRAPSSVGSYSSSRWLWMSCIVKQLFPTPSLPTNRQLVLPKELALG